jgi:hypothetical protein
VGVLGDVLTNAENIVAKGRLGPGQMVCADLEAGSFAENAAISKAVAARKPYKELLGKSLRRLEEISPSSYYEAPQMEAAAMLRLQVRGGAGRVGGRAWEGVGAGRVCWGPEAGGKLLGCWEGVGAGRVCQGP